MGRVLGASLLALMLAGSAFAQQPSGAMGGLQLQRDQPVKIESDTLEVRDKQRQATFSGSVKMIQGDTTITCRTLVVFYEDNAAAPQKNAPQKKAPAAAQAGGVAGGQQIKRVEATGDVTVVQKDQTAKGDKALFDVKSNHVTLTGNVVITQGKNVLRGERMVVDLTTGVARVESGSSKGGQPQRVEGLFNASAPQGLPGAKPAPAPAPQKAAPGAPTRINAAPNSSKKTSSSKVLQDQRGAAKLARVTLDIR